MQAINTFNETVNQNVNGEVMLSLSHNKVDVIAMDSKHGLSHASFSNGSEFNVNCSAPFIEINSYQMRSAYLKSNQDQNEFSKFCQ